VEQANYWRQSYICARESLEWFSQAGIPLVSARSLSRLCKASIVAKFGRAWEFMALRTPEGRLTRIGKEKEAMRHMIWHAIHTNWFEYKAGSHLYHFRFPICYQQEARHETESQSTLKNRDRQ
jgi:hypothetical protein